MAERRGGAWRRLFIPLLIAPLVLPVPGGCSLVAVQGPSQEPPSYPLPPVRCTTSRFIPIVDGVIASAAVLGTGFEIAMREERTMTSLLVLLAVGGGIIGTSLYSASVGGRRVDACREAKEKEHRRFDRLSRERVAPPPAMALPPAAASSPPTRPTPSPDGGQPEESPTVTPLPPEPRVPQRADPE